MNTIIVPNIEQKISPNKARLFKIDVDSRADGERVPATLVCCPECPKEFANTETPSTFVIYIPTDSDHAHLQCTSCGSLVCEKPEAVHAKTSTRSLVLCPACPPQESSVMVRSQFGMYVVHGHTHVQCARCTTTFCRGGECAAEEEPGGGGGGCV